MIVSCAIQINVSPHSTLYPMQYEMCMGTYPFVAKNEGALIRKILKGQYPQASGYSAELLRIITLCLTYDVEKRPTAHVLLARPEVWDKASTLKPCTQDDVKLHTTKFCTKEPIAKPSDQDNTIASKDEVSVGNNGQDARHPFSLYAVKRTPAAKVCLPSTHCGRCPVGTRETHWFMQDHDSPMLDVGQHSTAKDVTEVEQDRIIQRGYTDTARMRVEAGVNQMQAAGIKNDYTRRSAPYGKMHVGLPPDDLMCNASALWTHKYERPQFARKRCPDLMVSGPSIRAAQVGGQTVKPVGNRAYEASIGTTTTYQHNTNSNP